MWQYYVLVTLTFLALIGSINRYGKPPEVKHIDAAHAVVGLIVCPLMLWMQYGLLSSHWMWLSIGMMSLAILSSFKVLFEILVIRKVTTGDSRLGTILLLISITCYTIFYFKYVV